MSDQIICPSFKDAQKLYAQYSTIENISVLHSKLKETVDSSFLSTMSDKNIHEIYNRIIFNYYPNEICIKSSFIKQKLMKGKKHVTIFELPVGSSRADLCKINGTSVAYEIKTDLDNYSRLTKQITDYYQIFEEVYIICSERKVLNIVEIVPRKCGIYSYSKNNRGNYKFQLVRYALESNEISSIKQLNLVRKDEFKIYFNVASSLKERSEIIDYISLKYSSDSINQMFKIILKNRFQKQWDFLKQNHKNIYEIDYQWFYKNQIMPHRIYK